MVMSALVLTDSFYVLDFVGIGLQIFIQTGYPLDLPSGSLGSYCIYEYHMVRHHLWVQAPVSLPLLFFSLFFFPNFLIYVYMFVLFYFVVHGRVLFLFNM